MPSKTPKFDEELRKYFSELELDKNGGIEKICRISGEKFYVTAEDIEFYKKVGVSLPTLSPQERTRVKLASFNIYNLFYGRSFKTGKGIISAYLPSTKYQIWEHQIWNSDEFDPFSYGINYNSRELFFEQYNNLQLSVPRPNLDIAKSINTKYANKVLSAKNSYLLFDSEVVENSQMSGYVSYSKECYHCYATTNSEICYENTLSDNLYKCFFVEFSNNCVDSSFLFDCRDCTDCFMSSNLRHKKYYFYNQKLSKEEYQQKIQEINFGSRKVIEQLRKEFQELKRKAIHRANHNEKNTNCSGDYITNSKNCQACFYVEKSENIKYGTGAENSRDCMDVVVALEAEKVYESFIWDFGWYDVKFSARSHNLRESEYCDLCKNCSNCFACIGLKNKQFCIFNKQYSEEEYWQKVDEIKTKMLADGEYGEFFPKKLSPIPYNISLAVSFSGYDDLEVAKKYGYKIEEVEEPSPDTKNEIKVEKVPDDIKKTTDDILSKVIIDKNGKKFRYTKEELEFHRKYNLALPTEHYASILAEKRIVLGPIDFNPKYRNCTKCGQKTQVTFPKDYPNAPEEVWCEKCYNQEVN